MQASKFVVFPQKDVLGPGRTNTIRGGGLVPLVSDTPVANRLLGALPLKARVDLRKYCKLVELKYGEVLLAPGERIRSVFFPAGTFISLEEVVGRSATLEVALVGDEGMVGLPLVLGVRTSSLRALVQGAGTAWRVEADAFCDMLTKTPALRHEIDGYMHTRLVDLARSAACARFHSVHARLARLLLILQDRAHADRFTATQVMLGRMLGTRRAGVSVAAAALKRRRLIEYARGRVEVLNRIGLERASCDCYRLMNTGKLRD